MRGGFRPIAAKLARAPGHRWPDLVPNFRPSTGQIYTAEDGGTFVHDEAGNWWRQAQADFDAAQDNLGTDHHYSLRSSAIKRRKRPSRPSISRRNERTSRRTTSSDSLVTSIFLIHSSITVENSIKTIFRRGIRTHPQVSQKGMARSRIEKAEEVITWIEKRLTT